ncbi:flagellar basal body P-ring formation protein FlgA [Sulfurimonas aquatica]|uniref:Flagellar basal body P-ring formation protein FlgA n=1 Tax=Sulfurimonas aquatica TaxID=2672570 RepID=A0A975B0B9_9BACT|nr:flagellar basal body P-ring formation chaperone FlgA [Sulfurimonas aquatica]QSZ41818.1 flagellar basal body P-ring formation protein FlgA [Sulfurimonas aquatica]
MHSLFLFLFFTLSFNLFATTNLQNNYFIQNDYILLSDIVKGVKNDKKLFRLESNKHIKRIKSKELFSLLVENGITDVKYKNSYVQFTKQSPIDTSSIKNAIRALYEEKYPSIVIGKISVTPRRYLDSLPSDYTVNLPRNAHLSSRGTLYIKTLDRKKIFFDYFISAKIDAYVSKKMIERSEELSVINTLKKRVRLDRFRAMPIDEIASLQAKNRIKESKILTSRDVTGLFLIKRGATISVSIKNSNMAISFLAIAERSARLGDEIYVKNKKGNKIRVVATGHNRAEAR